MKYRNSKNILALILIIGAIFLLCSCSDDTNKEETADPTTRLITYSDENLEREVNSLSSDLNELHDRVASATNEEAADIKADIDQLRINISGFDYELEKAVDNNKLTAETKKSYDSFIENFKTQLDKLNSEISAK